MTYLGNKIDQILSRSKDKQICPLAEFLLLAAKDAQDVAEYPWLVVPRRDSMQLKSLKDKRMIEQVNRFIRGV